MMGPGGNPPSRRSAATVAGLTILGTLAFCIWSRSWEDLGRAAYDLAASPLVFYFASKTIVDGFCAHRDAGWPGRAALLLPLAVIPPGAEFLRWPLSGHLTDVLIAAGGIALSRGRSMVAVAAAIAAPLAVLYMRWTVMDQGSHARTVNAIWVAAACVTLAAIAALGIERRRSRDERSR